MRRRKLLSRLFLFSPPSNFLPSSLIRFLSYFFVFSFLLSSILFTLLTRRDIHEVLCIFDMSGGTDYGGLIIDDDKNLMRKMFCGGKQRKHGGNVRLKRSSTLDSLELPIFSILHESCNENKNCIIMIDSRKDFACPR